MPKTESYHDRPQMQMLYYRNGYFQVTRNAEANSYRLGWYPGMVSATQAPFFVAPLWQLFNQSLVTGIVPSQWNTAIITPVAKVPRPTKPSDYRPISVTPVLSRLLEKLIVCRYIYPLFVSRLPR